MYEARVGQSLDLKRSQQAVELTRVFHFLTFFRVFFVFFLFFFHFPSEPLYQIYQANVLQKERTLSLKRRKKSSYSEPSPTLSGNSTLKSGTLRGGKMLWCQLPEVGTWVFRIEGTNNVNKIH